MKDGGASAPPASPPEFFAVCAPRPNICRGALFFVEQITAEWSALWLLHSAAQEAKGNLADEGFQIRANHIALVVAAYGTNLRCFGAKVHMASMRILLPFMGARN